MIDLSAYRRDGYVLIDPLLSVEELAQVRAESIRICRGELGDIEGVDKALSGDPDAEVLRRYLCIHFPHKVSPLMTDLLAHRHVVSALEQIIGPDVKAMQSMLFIKAEGKPGQAWHQDEYFIPTRDHSLTAIWIALDDATVDNGCLWVIPGSHAAAVIYPGREIDDDRFDCTTEAYRFPYQDSDSIPVEVPAGGAVIFDGYLLHRSLPNLKAGSLRRAVANHYMSAQSLLPWRAPLEGEHMAIVDDRDIVMVAGKDPYAWKGVQERRSAFLRRDREGGCDR
jgi:phytanoyl-CoA hydroxylase